MTATADLPSSFIITFDGVPVGYNVESGEEMIQAETNAGNPAVFTFDSEKGLLKSGDYFLGRPVIEAPSLTPKPVFWFKMDDKSSKDLIQRTTIYGNEGECWIRSGNNSCKCPAY